MAKIAIIGGGISGISAAYKLLKNGYNVTLFEAGNSIGGRINSTIDIKTNDVIDNGQHIAIGAYKNFFELLLALDTFKNLEAQDTLEVDYVANGGYFKLKSSNNYILKLLKLDLVIGLLNFRLLDFKDKISIIKFSLLIKFTLDNLKSESNNKKHTVSELLTKYKQTENAIKFFWEPLCISTLNTNINEASSLVFLEVLRQGFLNTADKSKLYFSKVGLNDLVSPIQNYIGLNNSKIDIRLNTNIQEVNYSQNSQQNNNYILKDKLGNDYEFDYIISALNYDVFLKLFQNIITDKFKSDLQQIKSSPILSIYLWYNIDFIPFKIISIPNSNLQWVFNKRLIESNQDNNKIKGFYCVTISVADKLKVDSSDIAKTSKNNEFNLIEKSNNDIVNYVNDELLGQFKKPIENLLQDQSQDQLPRLLHYKIIKENKATFLCDKNIDNLRPSTSQEDKLKENKLLENTLYLAGDWVKNDFPSTIEGAVINGFAASEELINSLK